MHPNPIFRDTSIDTIRSFVAERGFGTLAINGDPVPLTAHVPFVLRDNHVLAHLVVSNPIWRALSDGPLPAVMTINGPDGYISPDWYDMPDQVPTWNYVAVRLTGVLHPLPDDQLRPILDDLSETFEARLAPKPVWRSDKMAPDAMAKLMRMIRPIRFDIEQTQSTWKLGQNKPDAARNGAADALESSDIGLETAALARAMRDIK